jgi:hypothetical protein
MVTKNMIYRYFVLKIGSEAPIVPLERVGTASDEVNCQRRDEGCKSTSFVSRTSSFAHIGGEKRYQRTILSQNVIYDTKGVYISRRK